MNPWPLLFVSEPGRDGVFHVVKDIIDHLHASHPDIRVHLAYSSVRPGPDLETLVKLVSEYGGEALDLKVGNSPQPADLRAVFQLSKMIGRVNPRVIHAHSSKAGALTRLCAFFPGFAPQVLYSPHAYYGMARKGSTKEKIFNLIESVLGQVGMTHNISADEATFAREKLGVPSDAIKVVPNGVDTHRFAPATAEEKIAARRALGIPLDTKLLVTIGRQSPQKNYYPLYNALNLALPGGQWSFAHAGAGAEMLRTRLNAAAAARCHSYEFLTNPQALLHAADAYIMTSRYEGLSLSMLEAFSAGVPLILDDVPGFRFLRAENLPTVRWLPDPAKKIDLIHPITQIMKNWQEPSQLDRDAQRRKACENYSLHCQLERMVELYQAMNRELVSL